MALAFLDEEHRDFVDCLPFVNLRDRFQVIRHLGRGNFSKVVLVRQRESGEIYAAKMVRMSTSGSATPDLEKNGSVKFPHSPQLSKIKDQFQFELTLAYFLSPCNHIIRTFPDAFRTNNHLVALMEPARGGDLAARLANPSFLLREHQLKEIMGQLVSAISFIHDRSLVHGDIRPENILIMDHNCSMVKLGDFGRTKKFGSMARYGKIVQMGQLHSPRKDSVGIGGENPYSPPEIADLSPVDFYTVHPSQDIWSLGVILYCLSVEGQPPWKVCSEKRDEKFTCFIDCLHSPLPKIVEMPSDKCEDASPKLKYQWRLSQISISLLSLLRGLLDIHANHRIDIREMKLQLDSKWLLNETDVVPIRSRTEDDNGQHVPLLSLSIGKNNMKRMTRRVTLGRLPDIDSFQNGLSKAGSDLPLSLKPRFSESDPIQTSSSSFSTLSSIDDTYFK